MNENNDFDLFELPGDHPIYRSGVAFISIPRNAAREAQTQSSAVMRALAGEHLTGEEFDVLANSPDWQPVAGRMDVPGVRLFGTMLEQKCFPPSRTSQNGLLQVARLHWPDAQTAWLVLLIPMSDRPLVAECADLSGTLVKMRLPIEKVDGAEVTFPLERPDLLVIETDWDGEPFGEFEGRASEALCHEDTVLREFMGTGL